MMAWTILYINRKTVWNCTACDVWSSSTPCLILPPDSPWVSTPHCLTWRRPWLEAGHSRECITDADHSIAFNKTVQHGCDVARRDGRAAPSRCATTQPQRDCGCASQLSRRDIMHFVTVTRPCDAELLLFDLILNGGRGIMLDYPCAKFGNFSFRRFAANFYPYL